MTPVADVYGPIRRTTVFVLALSTLLGLARSEMPAPASWAAFAIFISIATVWIRGQYADSLDGRQWVMPSWIVVPLIALAASLVLLLFVTGKGTLDKGLLAISGLVLLYLLVGSGLTCLRQSPSVRLPGRRVRTGYFGACLTVAGLVSVVGGAVLLGPAARELAGALLIGSGVLVLIPVGLALSSEGLLRRLCENNVPGAWLWALGGAGLAVFAGATATAVHVSRSAWLVVVLVILGLIMVGLVSTTQADIVAVMAVVALMGVTPPQAPKRDLPSLGERQRVLVALGDSFMSGEGAQVYHHGTDDGGVNECRRSPTAWADMAARNGANFRGFLFPACSGARTYHLLPDRYGSFYSRIRGLAAGRPEPRPQNEAEPTQLDAYHDVHDRFTAAMVVLSIGGNDAGFAALGQMCLAPGDCSERSELWTGSLPLVRDRLREVYRRVDRTFPGVPVVVIPYPDPIKISPVGRRCEQVALTGKEQEFIHAYVTGGLNATIRDTAREFGFHYLAEMQGALAESNLQLCDEHNGERPGINFIGLRSVRGVAEQRFNPANWLHSSLHPNERGHAEMLRVFEAWLAPGPESIPPRVRTEPPEVVGQALNQPKASRQKPKRQEPSRREPDRREPDRREPDRPDRPAPCDLSETRQGCVLQAKEWTYQQIGLTLLKKALWLWIAAACGGAWCAAVALFAYRRKVWARRGSCAAPA